MLLERLGPRHDSVGRSHRSMSQLHLRGVHGMERKRFKSQCSWQRMKHVVDTLILAHLRNIRHAGQTRKLHGHTDLFTLAQPPRQGNQRYPSCRPRNRPMAPSSSVRLSSRLGAGIKLWWMLKKTHDPKYFIPQELWYYVLLYHA